MSARAESLSAGASWAIMPKWSTPRHACKAHATMIAGALAYLLQVLDHVCNGSAL